MVVGGGMSQNSRGEQGSAFARWLRTGTLPQVRYPGGLELKFNPWHDPRDGRFTFSGAGRHYGGGSGGGGGGGTTGRANGRVDGDGAAPTARVPRAEASRASQSARYRKAAADRETIAAPVEPVAAARRGDRSNAAVEFVGGVGEGLYNVAEETVAGAYSALTTNPVTTIRNVTVGIADKIDAAIAAEDTPAHAQVARAADAVASASARELGRATGSAVGSAALTFAPGAAVNKIATARSLRNARPRETYHSPEIGWAKEAIKPTKKNKHWKPYNDSVDGARPDLAPTLMRTMPDGSKRPVKFDGIRADYLIDRKWSVSGWRGTVEQMLRQSDVLAQHRLIGVWEVPTVKQQIRTNKLFKNHNVRNIKAKVAKP